VPICGVCGDTGVYSGCWYDGVYTRSGGYADMAIEGTRYALSASRYPPFSVPIAASRADAPSGSGTPERRNSFALKLIDSRGLRRSRRFQRRKKNETINVKTNIPTSEPPTARAIVEWLVAGAAVTDAEAEADVVALDAWALARFCVVALLVESAVVVGVVDVGAAVVGGGVVVGVNVGVVMGGTTLEGVVGKIGESIDPSAEVSPPRGSVGTVGVVAVVGVAGSVLDTAGAVGVVAVVGVVVDGKISVNGSSTCLMGW